MKPQAHSVTQIFILKMKWSIPWIMRWRQYQPLIHNYYLPHWLRPSEHFSYPQDICAPLVRLPLPSPWILTGSGKPAQALRALLQTPGLWILGESPPVPSLTSQPGCCISWSCSISRWGCCPTTTLTGRMAGRIIPIRNSPILSTSVLHRVRALSRVKEGISGLKAFLAVSVRTAFYRLCVF